MYEEQCTIVRRGRLQDLCPGSQVEARDLGDAVGVREVDQCRLSRSKAVQRICGASSEVDDLHVTLPLELLLAAQVKSARTPLSQSKYPHPATQFLREAAGNA